jgi:hypothetical protein
MNSERGELLNAVVDAIKQTLAASLGRPVEVVLEQRGGPRTDGVLMLGLGGPPATFDIELKRHATLASVAALDHTAKTSDYNARPVILASARLSPGVMDACRRLGINCADADGNLFVRSSSVIIDITGRPPRASRDLEVADDEVSRLTSRSGLQVLFVLLSDPEMVTAPYRDIAAAADVSVGTVTAVLKGLEREGHLAHQPHVRRLRRSSRLLDVWGDGYRRRLFDRLRLGTFITDETHWWLTASDLMRQAEGQWGGETALWFRGRDLRPARGVAYVDSIPPLLVATLRLRQDARSSEAPVELRRRFWDVPSWLNRPTVPAPLIYAEAASAFRRQDDDLRRLDDA